MANVKDAAQIAEKWARVTPGRTEDYAQGIRNPKVDWSAATKAAEGNYEAGVQAAIQKKRFGAGVAKAGTQKWQQKAIEKGTARFGPGVQAAVADYQEGFEPFRQVIASTTLPPRYPKGDPRNLERVKVITQALRKKKVG
jgi:hypothetical protein